MPKLERLRELVGKRRRAEAGTKREGYTRDYSKLGDFYCGLYDFDDHVVPYSKSAFNLDAKFMLIGQDWASEEFLSKPQPDMIQADFGHDPRLPYNKNIFRLLENHLGVKFSQTYATDVFVFVKPGNMGTRIPFRDMALSCNHYALPQIKIVSPLIAICIGRDSYNSIRVAIGKKRIPIRDALDVETIMVGKTRIIGVPHVGGSATARVGGWKGQEQIWSTLAQRIALIEKEASVDSRSTASEGCSSALQTQAANYVKPSEERDLPSPQPN